MDTLRDKFLLNGNLENKNVHGKKDINFYKNKKVVVTGATGLKV